MLIGSTGLLTLSTLPENKFRWDSFPEQQLSDDRSDLVKFIVKILQMSLVEGLHSHWISCLSRRTMYAVLLPISHSKLGLINKHALP